MVYLFTSKKVSDFLAEKEFNLTKKIDKYLDSQIHREELDSIVDLFYEGGKITPNKLKKENIEKSFTSVETSSIRGKYNIEAVEYRIPYTGIQEYFELAPKTWSSNSPAVDDLNGKELIFKLWDPNGSTITNNENVIALIKSRKDAIVSKIEEWMQRIDPDLEEFNSTLREKIRNYVINKNRDDDDRRNSLNKL